jgi:hypothetical protein
MISARFASSIACLMALACLPLALEGCSDAHSQEVSGPNFFNLSVTTGAQSSPLPMSTALYQVESFSYYCETNPNALLLEVMAGPDAGMTVGLPSAGNVQGGGPLKFWLHAEDQVQIGGNNCQLHLFGQFIPGAVQNLQ